MPYVVSARRWRPQTFEELVGQEHVSRTLTNAIRAGRVAHAFLLTGVRGVGKTTAARILAKALNCDEGPTPTPCNSCTNCQEITAGSAVDVLEIDGASNTGVDDVREIIENVRYAPSKSRFKIYIIDEVHMLSNSAFNALLKTLEEPPSHVKFIFATTDPHKLPATVQSRCQRYDLRRIPLGLVVERLRIIVEAENVAISDRALAILAREGEGSMRDAQSLLDQVLAYGGDAISDEDVLATLGVADRTLLYELGDAIIDRQAGQALALLNKVHLHGYDVRRMTRDLVEHFRNLTVARVTGGELLPDVPEEEREALGRQAARMDGETCDRVFRVLRETDEEVGRSPYPKLVVEMALVKLATMPPLLPLEELLERMEELEVRLGTSGASSATGSPPPTKPTGSEQSGAPTKKAKAEKRRGSAAQSSVPAVGADGEGSPGWQDFVAFVTGERSLLAHHLSLCTGDLSENGILAIKAPRGFHHDYLARRDHVAEIETLARKRFDRDVQVRVTPGVAQADAEASEGREQKRSAAELTETVLKNPIVKAAVDILGGEVSEVRPRGTTKREKK